MSIDIDKAFEEKSDKNFREYLKSQYGENVFSDLPDYEINQMAIDFTAGAKYILEKIQRKCRVPLPNEIVLLHILEYIDRELASIEGQEKQRES